MEISVDYHSFVQILAGQTVTVIKRECKSNPNHCQNPSFTKDLIRFMFEARGLENKVREDATIKDYAYFQHLLDINFEEALKETLETTINDVRRNPHFTQEEIITDVTNTMGYIQRFQREAIEEEIRGWLDDKKMVMWRYNNSIIAIARTTSGARIQGDSYLDFIKGLIIGECSIDYAEFKMRMGIGRIGWTADMNYIDWLRQIL